MSSVRKAAADRERTEAAAAAAADRAAGGDCWKLLATSSSTTHSVPVLATSSTAWCTGVRHLIHLTWTHVY